MSDEERTIFFHDAREGLLTSTADKQRKAMKHFDKFLEKHCVQIGIDVVTAAAIPYHGIPRGTSNKEIFDFWDKMIGAFITYMGSHAKAGCKQKGNPLSQNTSEGYCSSVKVFFTTRFRVEISIPVFQSDQWRILRDKLKAMYRESTRSNPAAEGKASSTRQDREAMATACIWLATPEYAEFWHLLNTSYHCSGRCSETSLVKSKGVKTTEVNEMVYNYKVLSVDIQRQKNGPFQSLPIYPHRDGVLEDFYFSLIHLTVVKGANHNRMLPNFSKAALKKTQGKSDSAVSKEWTKSFQELTNAFEVLADEINEELSSKSNRKGSNQVMAECPSLGGFAQIFRSGWSAKSIHSVFDYMSSSSILTQQAGKAVARWTMKIGDTIIGGQPPTYDDIHSDPDTLKKFTGVLFEDDKDGNWSQDVRELLTMALLLGHDEFVNVLEAHPFATLTEENPFGGSCSSQGSNEGFVCSTVAKNQFLCRINSAMARASAEELFPDWIKEARQAFLTRNGPALPIERFNMYGGLRQEDGGFLVDSRTFVDHFNCLASTIQVMHMEQQRQRHILNDICNAINNESKITSSFIIGKIFNMERMLQRVVDNTIGAATTPAPVPPPKGLRFFSVVSSWLPKKASLTELTTAFFFDNYKLAYDLEKKSQAYRDMDGKEKKALTNKFTSIKRVVRIVLLCAEKFPLPPEDPELYKGEITRLASDAEQRIREAFGFNSKTITFYKLEKELKKPEFKEMEQTRELPANTPDDARKFWNS